MSTERTPGRQLRPNLVLTAQREKKGWMSRRKAARELHKIWRDNLPGVPDLEALEKALYRHETGRVQVRDETYRKLYCLAYNASPHELFGVVSPRGGSVDEYGLRSHKFIPAFVGVEAAARLAKQGCSPAGANQWFDCHATAVEVIDGECAMYVWPFGVVVFHLVEDLSMPSLAALAVWRLRSYEENLDWATSYLRELLSHTDVAASYVLSLYWVHTPAWSGGLLDTALRILCMPKVLLEHQAAPGDGLGHAELVERTLLAEDFDHAEMVPFGVKGIAAGYASWSGVVYCPIAEQRALPESDLVACELATQALWAYCGYINDEVEQGRDPAIPPDYGWRFLRAVRSRLTNPRPQETGQHRSMRNGILETSGIVNHLAHAIETLRDTNGG